MNQSKHTIFKNLHVNSDIVYVKDGNGNFVELSKFTVGRVVIGTNKNYVDGLIGHVVGFTSQENWTTGTHEIHHMLYVQWMGESKQYCTANFSDIVLA